MSKKLDAIDQIRVNTHQLGNMYIENSWPNITLGIISVLSLGLGALLAVAVLSVDDRNLHNLWVGAALFAAVGIASLMKVKLWPSMPKWLRRWKQRSGHELENLLKEIHDFNVILGHRKNADTYMRKSIEPELYEADVNQLQELHDRLQARLAMFVSEIGFVVYDRILSQTGSSEGYEKTKDLSTYVAAARARHALEP